MASTESIQVGSNALNLELLINRSNYNKWRLRVKTYLLAEDLWDVIEAIGEPPKLEDDQAGYKAWTKKNARALVLTGAIAGWGYGQTAFHISARIGHAHIVKDLVRLMGPEYSQTKTCYSGNTALHLAAAQGHAHVVRALPVELIGHLQENDGETALHYAVNAGKVDVVKELVKLWSDELKFATPCD